MREGGCFLCFWDVPEYNLILTYYMLIAWWLQLLDGLGHYFIRPGAVVQILVMTNSIITLG